MTFADNGPSLDLEPDLGLDPDTGLEPSPASITLDRSELTLDVGGTDPLTATLHPEGTSGSVQWTSSDPAVASVSENGLITAHSRRGQSQSPPRQQIANCPHRSV